MSDALVRPPLVCCVCLTADRPKLTDRAVKCFEAQTYADKVLLIWDSGGSRYSTDSRCVRVIKPAGGYTIGELRNQANAVAFGPMKADMVAHWDSDDWSAPARLEEQVKLLQESGADAVGYSDMLFWDSQQWASENGAAWYYSGSMLFWDSQQWASENGAAWYYSGSGPGFVLGTSLMYRRRTWEAKKFEHTSKGEDTRWIEGLKIGAASSGGLAMVAEIHGGNTCARIVPGSIDWHRMPEWDARLREIMNL